MKETIITSTGKIDWQADGLLDIQIMEALTDLINNHDNVKLLQKLQEMAK